MLEKLTKHMTVRFSVSNNTIFRVLLITLAFVATIRFVSIVSDALVLIGVAFFLALALSPPVNFLARKVPKGSRGIATAIAYLCVLAFFAALLYIVVPPLFEQTRNFVNNLPNYVNDLEHGNSWVSRQVQKYGLIDSIRESQTQLSAELGNAGGPILNVVRGVTSSIASIITVLVLTFFMLVEGPAWVERIVALQPKERREHRMELASQMYRVVTGYVNGQVTIAIIGALATLLMLLILDISYAIPLAVIVGVFALIPLIGATLGAVVVVSVAFFKSVTAGLILLAFYIIYQQFENSVIQPMVQARSVELSPLIILITAIIGVSLAGLLGALVAIPVAGCIRVLLNDYLDRNNIKLHEPAA